MNNIRVCLNGEYHTVEAKIFSGGEIHVNINHIDMPYPSQCYVKCNIQSSDDIMMLFMTIDALRRKYPNLVVDTVSIPYFAYSRQDRVCTLGDAFSLEVFAKMLSNNGINTVYTYDLHSNAGFELLTKHVKLINHDQTYIFTRSPILTDLISNPDVIIASPDKGAFEKTKRLVRQFRKFSRETDFLVGEKVRDPTSGALSGFDYEYSEKIVDKDIVIVDDICDGGGTFIGLANKLLENNAKSVSLYVTHGIFSRGFDCFKGSISHIYTTDSFRHKDLVSNSRSVPTLTVIHI